MFLKIAHTLFKWSLFIVVTILKSFDFKRKKLNKNCKKKKKKKGKKKKKKKFSLIMYKFCLNMGGLSVEYLLF